MLQTWFRDTIEKHEIGSKNATLNSEKDLAHLHIRKSCRGWSSKGSSSSELYS